MISPTERDRPDVMGDRDPGIADVEEPTLGHERTLLKVLFDRMPMGIAIFDREARLRRYNPTWAEFIERYTPTPASRVATGASLFDLAPGTEARFRAVLERVVAGETVRLEGFRSESGGIVSYWDVVFAPLVENEEVVGFIDITIDATERELSHRTLEQRVEERTRELRQRRRVAEGLRDILNVLNSDRPRGEILGYIVAEASHLLGSNGGVVYHLDHERACVTIEASYGLPEEFVALETFPLQEGSIVDALFSRRPVAIPDLSSYLLAEDSFTERAAQDVGIRTWLDSVTRHYRAYLGVPLVIKDQMYGTLGVYYQEPQTFSDEEIQLAVAFGDQAALAIENARLRTQASQVAVVAERERLARELHDSVTQSLYSLTLLAEASQRLVGTGDLEPVREYTLRLGEIAQQALREMRLLVYQLRPLVLKREGLVGALQQRLDAVEKRAGVDARLLVEGSVELPAEVEEGLYRIAQEALNNALKHAAATSVTVRIQTNARGVTLEVSDDGRGFDPEGVSDEGGMGLANMRERAERLGGSLVVLSAPGEGTTVRLSLEVSL
jgi:signal transduction histidine kinase